MEENLIFDRKELSVLYALLNISVVSLNNKRHKSQKDIEVTNELKKLRKKIDIFLSKKG